MHDGGSEARCMQVPRTVVFRIRMHDGGSEARCVQVQMTVVFRIRMHGGGSEARCVRVPRTVVFRIRMHGRGSDIAVRRRRAQCSARAAVGPRSVWGLPRAGARGGCTAGRAEAVSPGQRVRLGGLAWGGYDRASSAARTAGPKARSRARCPITNRRNKRLNLSGS